MKAISIDRQRDTVLLGEMTKAFIHQKLQIQSVQSWQKNCKCKSNLEICCYFCYCCYYFTICLIDMQRFWVLSCHLQYTEGRRNSGDSLIPQLYNSFEFCIFLLYWSSCPPLKGLLCTFAQPVVHHRLCPWHCQCTQPCPLPPTVLLPSPIVPCLQETTFWTLSLLFHKSLLVHFFQAALRDIYHPVPSLTVCPF